MSEIKIDNQNPLSRIFKMTKDGTLVEEISSINNIHLFFYFLSDEDTSQIEKINIIEIFLIIIKKNRYILEFFSEYNGESIYIFFFKLFLSPSTSSELKTTILNLFQELLINVETSKNVYEYLFQKLSSLYRNSDATQESMFDLLTLLNTIMGDVENIENPRNYFCCSGKGRFEVDLSKENIKLGKYLTFIINFKTSETIETKDKQMISQAVDISNLIKINFSNGTSYTIILQNQYHIKIKETDTHLITHIPNEWTNFILFIYKKDTNLDFYFFSNGENNFNLRQLKNNIGPNDTIDSIIFFDNFYGEVTSMSMAITREGNLWCLSNEFLKWFGNYKEGFWNRKYIENFFKMLKELKLIFPSFITKKKELLFYKQDTNETPDENTPQKNYINYFNFIFTPFNFMKDKKGEVESTVGNIKLNYSGNIRAHRYQFYQNRLSFVDGIANLMPIAEMFLIRPKILNEENLEIFLKIITNVLNLRKLNIEELKKINFFQILSLFIEKYPKHLFTEKILENFVNLGKTIFSNDDEELISSYFEHIFLNEKILSKYSENLQIKFWQKVLLFCQTDKEQVSTFMNMNRICLILRFYDKNKYSEMCCEKHLSEIKDKFIGNKTIMNPTMETKLSDLREVFQLIISAQHTASGVISLYRLLTLDLSPCLTKFILNVFSYSLNDKNCSDELKISLKNELIDNKYEVIAINTFIHSLPDVRYDLLKLMFEIHTKLKISFSNFQNMIKNCLLPQQMFYATYKESKAYLDEIERAQMEEKKKKLLAEKKKKDVVRMSSVVTSKLINNKNKLDFKNIQNRKLDKEKKNKDEDDIFAIKEVEEKEIDDKENHQEKKKENKDYNKIEIKDDKGENKEENREEQKEDGDNIDFKDNLKIDNYNELKSHKDNENIKINYISKSIVIKPNEEKEEEIDLYEDNEEKDDNDDDNKENIKENDNSKNDEEKKENIIKEEKNTIENVEENGEDMEKEIIIKDELFEQYKIKLFNKFLLWSLGMNIENELNLESLSTVKIEYLDILEIIFVLDEEIQDINLTLKFFELIKTLISLDFNCFKILTNKKIFANFLDLTFKFSNSKNDIGQKIYQLGRQILFIIFANSFNYIIEKKNIGKYPCFEIRTMFLWGEEIIKTNRNYNNVLEFINSILSFLMIQLDKYETKINFKVTTDIKSNFFLKNYLIFNTQLFGFSFHFQDFYNNFKDINLKEKVMDKYTSSMILDFSKNRIMDIWQNFSFFIKLYKKLNYIWQKENIFKKFKLTSQKGNKLIKYENILQKLILDKNNKNVYLSELIFLTYEESITENNIILSLLRIITISLMSIISVLAKIGNNEKELRYWLKEFKKFILFLIIASTNLTRANQLDLYNIIQNKVMGPIIICICFLKDIISTTKICKEKIKNSLHSILLFCFLITKYEHQYIIKHKSGFKFFNLSTKPARNDLKASAVYLLFNEILKDKSGNILLPLSLFDKLNVSQYINIVNLLDNKEWDEALFNNSNLKNKLLTDFFTFNVFKEMKDFPCNLIQKGKKEKKFTEEILYLLPLYEKELSKYSNNSLENTIQKKNRYKAIKKRSFSWNGLWSDKKLFFETPEKLKQKIINHYTKTLMKPLLSPILDIDYYLPEFTYFKKENMFRADKEENDSNKNKFKLTMDMDKILKISEQNQIAMNNIKEVFGENKKKLRENYLRKIYLKSDSKLAESLQKISNNLDLGKEDEFTKLEHNEGEIKSTDIKKPRYVLACLVKTSHHIKGVCFIDENNLNFKVFLNQKTGNSMSGVELAFTNKDDDYDINRQTCFGSYFICHPKDKDLYQISINYKDIKWIFRRRYYYKNSGIEIFTRTNKSFYLNFKFEDDREYVINEVVNKISDISIIYDDLKDPKDSFDNVIGFENIPELRGKKKNKKIKLSKRIEMWKNWEISNFEFLMWLNIFGNRSYNDISQYPVFPWILGNYEDPLKTKIIIPKKAKKFKKSNSMASLNLNDGASESDDEDTDYEVTDEKNEMDYTYRDLSLPMGMLELNKEGTKRKELFMEMYESLKMDGEGETKPFLYGSNYSNPVYVCNFMMRLFPFSHIAIELQGNKFDNPERLFISVKNSFFNSLTQKTDVRELIPEFFYFPEIFLNLNKLNLGQLEDGTLVDNILTPCKNNPYNFVMTMKTVLESEKVSKFLQKWVDLIFGFQARGKEAEQANNLFTEKSYQENVNLKNEEDKETILRQVEFGLIPTQILNKSCSKRTKKKNILKGKEVFDTSAFISFNKCRKHSENINPKHFKDKKDKNKNKNKNKDKGTLIPIEVNGDISTLCVGCFSSEKISIFSDNFTFEERRISCPVFDKVYTDELLIKTKCQYQYNTMSEFYSSDSINHKAISFAKQGRIVILGGFFDGKVVFIGTDGKGDNQIDPFKDEYPVLCIEASKDDEYIFMGNALGNVCVFKNIEGKYKNTFLLTDQKSALSHIYYSPQLNLLATASIDGYICLYTLPLCKLIRCLKVPNNNCIYVMLSDSPLPVIIVVCEGQSENNEIYVYSINGHLYLKKEVGFRMSNPLIVKSIDSNDYLACIGEKNIYILSIPDLIDQMTVEKTFDAHSICFSEDNKILYAINKKGTEIMVIKGEKEKNNKFRSATILKK